MPWSKKNKIVLAGAPGVGKSTVIKLLTDLGHTTVPEVARIIIEESIANNSDLLPWKDLQSFQNELARRQVELEELSNFNDNEKIFMDRGLIDQYAFCKHGNVSASPLLEKFGRGRYEKILILEPLQTYEQDPGRLLKREDSLKLHELVKEAYSIFGYDVVLIPPLPPEERVEFILKQIA